jgi:hypothetical protein
MQFLDVARPADVPINLSPASEFWMRQRDVPHVGHIQVTVGPLYMAQDASARRIAARVGSSR